MKKTTLVRTLAVDLAPLEGYVSSAPTTRVAVLAQAQGELTGSETVIEFPTLRNFTTCIDAPPYVYTQVYT